jgi:hypothetical protein
METSGDNYRMEISGENYGAEIHYRRYLWSGDTRR